MGKIKKQSHVDKEHAGEDKPLPRLVLKVNKEKKNKEKSDKQAHHSGHSHHKKKKKHKHHKHKHDESEKRSRKREATENMDAETPVKKVHVKIMKEKEDKKVHIEPEVSGMRLCLENLHRTLQRKDVYGIFTNPVTDLIAPGYSKIIKIPMDFQTMERKIVDGEYVSIGKFKDDYVTMCNNAMLYNGPETIYFKSAEKMLAIGMKLMSKERIKKLHKAMCQPGLDSEDDVIQVDESSDVNVETSQLADSSKKKSEKKRHQRELVKHQSFVDSVLLAAQNVRNMLQKQHPNQKYGYLTKDTSGNTTYNILNPDTTNDSNSAAVTIGKVVGKLPSGITLTQTLTKHDKQYRNIPVNYLLYGPYGSFGPTFDSSLSDVSKTESDLLLQAYGTEEGVLYAKSIQSFCKDSAFALDYADRLLNIITDGAHSKLSAIQKKPIDEKTIETKVPINTSKPQSSEDLTPVSKESSDTELIDVDIASLLSLNGLGIDVSFLNNMVSPSSDQQQHTTSEQIAQEKLSENAALLSDLNASQNQRLSNPNSCQEAVSKKEEGIATMLTNNLKSLIRTVAPKDIVSSEGVKKAIGSGSLPMTACLDENLSAVQAIEIDDLFCNEPIS